MYSSSGLIIYLTIKQSKIVGVRLHSMVVWWSFKCYLGLGVLHVRVVKVVQKIKIKNI